MAVRHLVTQGHMTERRAGERPEHGRNPTVCETSRRFEIGQHRVERPAIAQRCARAETIEVGENRRHAVRRAPVARSLFQHPPGPALRGRIATQRLYRGVDTHRPRPVQPIPARPLGIVS